MEQPRHDDAVIRTLTRAARATLIVGAALMTPACQTAPAQTPAVLVRADPPAMAAIEAALAEATGRSRVQMTHGDLTATSAISVLPPPLSPHEDRSTALPTQFDLTLVDGRCALRRRADGQTFPLADVPCRPAP